LPATPAALYALTTAIQPVRRAWLKATAAALEGSGLSVSLATVVLLVFRHGGGMRQNALAEEVGVNPAALVRTLDQAEAAGLLERQDTPGDRRSKGVHLLPEGERLALIIEADVADLRARLLGDLPQDEVETAARVLRQFEERIGAFLQETRAGR
jgi:MarR family transcriptional regulator for hemolysin